MIAADFSELLHLHERACAIVLRHANRRDEEELVWLREVGCGSQRAARLVTFARTGNRLGMFLRTAILFAEQAGRINQAARNRRQPNERQHERDRCLDTPHGETNTTPAQPVQSRRLAARRLADQRGGNVLAPNRGGSGPRNTLNTRKGKKAERTFSCFWSVSWAIHLGITQRCVPIRVWGNGRS